MIAAIVPAAGRSERMGRPKLILPIGGTTIIARVTSALREGGADPVIVVVPPATVPGASTLATEAMRAGACVVIAPGPTLDMRASVELGLDRLELMPPRPTVLLAPGDSPGISANLVRELIAQASAQPHAIVIPQAQGRRGHPIALPWSLAAEIRRLPDGVGINSLVARHTARVITIDVADPAALDDVDTPADFRRWSGADRDRDCAPGVGILDGIGPEHDDEGSNRENQSMRVTVRLFAVARQRAGRAELVVDVPEPVTVAALKRALAETVPELAPLVPQLMIAIDADYAIDDARRIPPGAEVAAIPPVSGGGQGAYAGVAP
jgi:molybdenum cofactor cytidylyltransferase